MNEAKHNSKGQVIGIFKNGVFRKNVNSERHKMKIYDAYGVDEGVVKELKNARLIVINEKDTGIKLECPFKIFIEKSFVRNYSGEQRFLPMKYWTKVFPDGRVVEGEREIEDYQQKLFQQKLL